MSAWGSANRVAALKEALVTVPKPPPPIVLTAQERLEQQKVKELIREQAEHVADIIDTPEPVAKASPVPTVGEIGDGVIRKVVLDTAAFIRGAKIDSFGADCEYYTIPEVVSEIRDEESRERFRNFPFKIHVIEPSPESIAYILEVARKLGEEGTLSIADKKVLALTHMLEVQSHGTRYLKPVVDRSVILANIKNKGAVQSKTQKPKQESKETKLDPESKEGEKPKKQEPPILTFADMESVAPFDVGLFVTAKPYDFWVSTGLPVDEETGTLHNDYLAIDPAEQFANLNQDEDDDDFFDEEDLTDDEEDQGADEAEGQTNNTKISISKRKGGNATPGIKSRADANEKASAKFVLPGFDDGQWITPDNLEEFTSGAKLMQQSLGAEKKVLGKRAAASTSESTVACITADFAMQNTLLQAGLRVVAASTGFVLRTLRYFVNRCHACLTISTEMRLQFCPKCGGHTMVRTSVFIDEKGRPHYRWNERQVFNLRGTIFSIPKMRGGRNSGDIQVREPDPDSRVAKLMFRTPKQETDLFDQAAFFGGKREDVPEFVYGYGKRHPNKLRRTGKRK